MLKIVDLHATVADKPILQGLSLEVKAGEVHAIMGPNGAGKSTLSRILSGDPNYAVTSGQVEFMGQDLFAMAPEERARAGFFLGYQYPVGIPGVSNVQFLRAAVNALREARGEPPIDAMQMLQAAREGLKQVDLDNSFLQRPVNEGFSGGEKKRNELLQMLLLQPRFCLLDEVDSGLDIDALKVVGDVVNGMRAPDRSFLLITHYRRLLDHIHPDKVHILANGKIVASGGIELAEELERTGYRGIAAA
ncbi:MAG: Fe-S cluster assembly ATPase SufC [Spongiibacteraceae bacterium]|jgi:Fe-S cluster assembly ATP-binding protein|nr:Fe-S cluster assembly ATPase SufC [Spongiibacteraceae bacterium]